VQLEWEIFDATLAEPSWQVVAATPANLTLATDTLSPSQTMPAPGSLAHAVNFPLSARGQAVLYATRQYARPDGVSVKLRSNPLFVVVHGGAAS
jgi:hypothetical protein